jgi:hypothetical protein
MGRVYGWIPRSKWSAKAMTFSPRAIEAAAEAMKLGVCQYCRQPAVGAGGGVVDCNCPYRVWDEPTDKERAQIALTAALAVDGVALVPREPTEAMIIAGCENNPTQWNEGTDLGFAADVANDVYRAMITAASDGDKIQ